MIVKQMFSRVKISEGGDAQDFVMGEIVEKSKFLEVNSEIKKAGGKPAKAEEVLLGITRIALSAESFLSAASFQDTSRVLVKAAIEGKIDKLRGLKENVIIGRLIPAGSRISRRMSAPRGGRGEEEEPSSGENEALLVIGSCWTFPAVRLQYNPMTNEEKDKKEYELALLLNSEDDLAGVIKLVGTHNAEGLSEPRAKRLQLAYEIKSITRRSLCILPSRCSAMM